jgi:hypothetical protein
VNHSNIFPTDIRWGRKAVGLLLALTILPNILGAINFGTLWGFKIHTFQLAVFAAAFVYGPTGGLASGFFGSLYSAIVMKNPYIMVGNAILGFFAGLFARRGVRAVYAGVLAYAIQLPWLVLSDYYLAHLPMTFIKPLAVALLFSNIVWAAAADRLAKPLTKLAC